MILRRISIAFGGFVLALNTIAQNNPTLQNSLQLLEEKHEVIFSYNPELVASFNPLENVGDGDLISIISQLNSQYPFKFEQIDARNIIVSNKPISLDLTVIDEKNKEPVPSVYVKLNDHYLQTVSDVEGQFTISFEWSSEDTLSFEFVGYETYQMSVLDFLANELSPIIPLSNSTLLLDELVIESYLGDGINANQQNHSIQIKNGDLGILPGDVDKDVLTSLKSLPGIHSVTGRAGELRVRGGTPDHTLILYNDIPIFHKGYYYGTVSPFSTDIVENIAVYRSGYSANLGGRVGGAVILENSNEVPDSLNLGIATNSYFASAYLKTPIIKNKLGFTLAARTSHPFNYISPKESAFEDLVIGGSILSVNENIDLQPVTFKFYDINGAFNYESEDFGKWELNYLNIENEVEIEFENQDGNTIDSRDAYLRNDGLSTSWNKDWGNISSEIYLAWSKYQYDNVVERRLMNLNNPIDQSLTDNFINHFKAGVGFSQDFESAGSLQYGYEYIRKKIGLVNDTFDPQDTIRLVNRNERAAGIHSAFGNYLIPHNKYSLDLGLRFNQYELNDYFRAEPRIFANYFIDDHFSLKGNIGLYSQDITQNIFFELNDVPNEKLIWIFAQSNDQKIITSWQALTGISFQSKHWVADIDLYYKEVQNISTTGNIPELGTNRIITRKFDGELYSKGIDFILRYQNGPFDMWGTYTLSSTKLFFPRIKTEPFYANYDQTHLFNVTAALKVKSLRLSAGWFFASGIPNYLEEPFFPGTGGPASGQIIPRVSGVDPVERFDAIHQLDASISYQYIPQNKWIRITAGFSVLNLYDRNNLLETANIYLVDNGMGRPTVIQADRYTIGFTPDFMLKLEF